MMRVKILIVLCLSILAGPAVVAGEEKPQSKTFQAADVGSRTIDMSGPWRFQFDKDHEKGSKGESKNHWEKPGLNDSKWDTVIVGKAWEEQGYADTDGVAWYRAKVAVPKDWAGNNIIILNAGIPDDGAEAYWNGISLGATGNYGESLSLVIPQDKIRFGNENIVAIRVWDWFKNGGLEDGVFTLERFAPFSAVHQNDDEISLKGAWRFKVMETEPDGAEMNMKDPDYDDSAWRFISIGIHWEKQGYKFYNGIAWYRQQVMIPDKWKGKSLELKLGKPDDKGEVFFNGTEVCRVEKFGGVFSCVLEPEQIRYGKANTIAVRISDNYQNGGLTEAPFTIKVGNKNK